MSWRVTSQTPGPGSKRRIVEGAFDLK